MTVMMTFAQVVETSVTSNSPSQDYSHPGDRTPLSYDMTPGLKPCVANDDMHISELTRINACATGDAL